MQYAEVATPVRTASRQETFTYRIPPGLLADVKIGQRVTVPFGRRQVIGTVIHLTTRIPKLTSSLKEIKKIIETLPLFDAKDIALARKVATAYAATLGEVLESAAPRLAMRVAKTLLADQKPQLPTKTSTSGAIYGLYLRYLTRYSEYLYYIREAQTAGKRALLIFPSQELASEFFEILRRESITSLLLPPSIDLTGYYLSWWEARLGEYDVVIGTRKAIFLSPPNLRLIIVDRPSEYGYKEEQFPYYHAATVAKLKAVTHGAHIIFGDATPRFDEWYDLKRGKLQLLTQAEAKTKPPITLIDTSTNRGLLPDVLLDHLKTTLEGKGKIAIIYNRKGTGRFYHCLECETALYCPNCDSLLTVHEEGGSVNLVCPHCSYRTKPPYECHVCHSYRLGSVGLGVHSFAKIIQDRFPSSSVRVLTKEETTPEQADIVIATTELLYLPLTSPFDLLVAFQTDQLLHGASWRTREEGYLRLSHFLERTKHLIIQTAEPENGVLQAFCQQDIDRLYLEELERRQKHGYPPVQPVLRLLSSGTDLEKVQKEVQVIHEKLSQFFGRHGVVLSPGQIGSGKRRGKYRYQIIVKVPLSKELLALVPTTWQVDPEPLDFN